MIYIKGKVFTYMLGNRIFYCEGCGRHVLCDNAVQAAHILSTLGLEAGEITQCASLDETTKFKHLCGERITVVHRQSQYICDTKLALGSPSTIDTTRPLTLIYKRCANDNT